jgi:hypothetical protein
MTPMAQTILANTSTSLTTTSSSLSTRLSQKRNFTTKQLAGACCMILSYNVKKDFVEKHLTGRSLVSTKIDVRADKVVWTHAPRRYDTAHYIKHRQIVNESGSYALDLQNYGSRFYVYKIRRNPDGTKYRGKQSGSRAWEQKNLQKVRVYKYLGNHKNYFGKAFNKMAEFLISLGGEIEWNIH